MRVKVRAEFMSPFDLRSFYRRVPSYENSLERLFGLVYHTGLSAKDIDDMDVKSLSWIYGRLHKQLKNELEYGTNQHKPKLSSKIQRF